MEDDRTCEICGLVLGDRCKLYRHRLAKHVLRYCHYCDFVEGRPSRMRKHVTKKHPTVQLSDDERNQPWKLVDDPMKPIPVSFPTPPGYSPYLAQDIPTSWDYVPTVQSKPASSGSITTPEWEILDELDARLSDLNQTTTASEGPQPDVIPQPSLAPPTPVTNLEPQPSTSSANQSKPHTITLQEYRTRQADQ